jgi:hypothetical protein
MEVRGESLLGFDGAAGDQGDLRAGVVAGSTGTPLRTCLVRPAGHGADAGTGPCATWSGVRGHPVRDAGRPQAIDQGMKVVPI